MTLAAIETGKLDIGRVIQGTFGVIGRNFVTFFVLALVLSGLPTAIFGYVQAGQTAAAASGDFNFSIGYLSTIGLGGLATMITAAILQGSLVFATVQDLNGAKPSLGEGLATGLRAFLPLLGLSILLVCALVGGFILLVVPGLMMLCAWIVVVPSLIADRTGVMGAFSRSAELTRGNRWRIFGLLIIVWIVALLIGAIGGGVAAAMALGDSGVDPVQTARSPAIFIGSTLINTLTTMVTSAGVAVLYVELRKAREGQGPQWLSEIFS